MSNATLVITFKYIAVKGNEMEILSDLIHGGALPYLDNVHIDWPKWTKDDQGRFIKDTKHEQFR